MVLVDRFRDWLAGVPSLGPEDSGAVGGWLDGAVASILAGRQFAIVAERYRDDLAGLFPGRSGLMQDVLVESTSVLVAAALHAGHGYDVRTIESILDTPAIHAAGRTIRESGGDRYRTGRETSAHGPDNEPVLRALFDTSTVGVCLSDAAGSIFRVNQRFLDIIGLPAERVIGGDGLALFSGTGRYSARQQEAVASHVDGEAPRISIESVIERPDGSHAWISGDSIRVPGQGGEPLYFLGFIEDITDRKTALRLQRNSEERIQALIQNSSDVIGIISETGTVEFVSDSIERILGYDPTTLTGQNVLGLIAVESQAHLEEIFLGVLEAPRGQAQSSARAIHADGSWRWMEIDFTNLMDVPSVGGVVVTARDVTKRKTFEQQLERVAYFDTLTALPNRMQFRERLDDAMASLETTGERIAVVFVDLDRFKMINDRFGHDGGDSALVAVGQRILDSLRPGEMVARLGGEEFALLIERATPARAMQTANRVLAAIAQRFPEHNRFFNLSATAGVAISSPLLNQPSEILRAADIAMYQGKHVGGGVATMFQPAMYDEAFARAELDRDLRLALDRQEMEPWFLPEYDLDTGKLRGFEVLMRWRRRNGQLVTPGSFIDVAMDLSIIVPLGLHILREACERLVEWNAAVPRRRHLPMSFNVSYREMSQPGYPLRIAEVLGDTGLDPALLAIEVDDRVFREPRPELDRFVAAIGGLGMRLIVDNFGGGYASWSQLRRLKVDQVKFDRDAIGSAENVEATAAMLKVTTAMASEAGIVVTAVGLEDEDLVSRARAAGFHRGQGFHLHPPFPAGDIHSLPGPRPD